MNIIKKNNDLRPFYPGILDDLLSSGWAAIEDKRGVPALNIKEDNQELVLELRVPGMNKENFHLDYSNGILTISGERSEEKEDKEKEKYLKREFNSYSFQRSFELSEDRYDVVKAQAAYKEGILEVTLPKKEQQEIVGRKIEVK